MLKLKIIVMGEENSGKSKLLFNFVDYYVNIFQECGVEGGTKFVNLDETKVTLLFWGISGLDDLRSLPKNDLCEFAGHFWYTTLHVVLLLLHMKKQLSSLNIFRIPAIQMLLLFWLELRMTWEYVVK